MYYPDGTRSSFGYQSNPPSGPFDGNPSAIVSGSRILISSDLNSLTATPTYSYETPAVRLSWSLASSVDRFNNEVKYSYENFGVTGPQHTTTESLPIGIEYNLKNGNGDRTVQFTWEPRQDVRQSFVSGVEFQNTKRLKSIVMNGPNPTTLSQLRIYQLGYADVAGQHAQLTSVQECDRGNVCKAPTNFTWTVPGTTFVSAPATTWSATNAARIPFIPSLLPADINGDGRDDLLFTLHENSWYFSIANADGSYQEPVAIPSPTTQGPAFDPYLDLSGRVADLNADGLVDFLYPRLTSQIGENGSTSGSYLLKSTGNGFTSLDPGDIETTMMAGDRFDSDYVGDFNGDGLPDIMRTIVDTTDPAVIAAVGLTPSWGLRLNSAPPGGLGTYQPVVPLWNGLADVRHR